MTALDIMNQARERLGDEKKQRWSDSRLLSIVSQGQVDICTESGYLRQEVLIPLVVGETRFNLPSDCFAVKRVEYDGIKLPLHQRSDKDVGRISVTSDYVAYKSNLQMDKLEVIPAIEEMSREITFVKGDFIDDSLYVANPYGVVVSTDDIDVTVDPVYGVVTGLELTSDLSVPSDKYGEVAGSSTDVASVDFPNGEYGVVIEAEYAFTDKKYGGISAVKGHIVSGKYGIVASIASKQDTFHVYYSASPAKLKFKEAILVMPEIWEDLLMRYVVGTALQDDNDANNIQRGELEIAKYEKKLKTIKDLSSKDFSAGASDKLVTNYRRI